MWALYPETANRTLEEIDLLFCANTPWNWDAEATFARLKKESPSIAHGATGPAKAEEGYADEEEKNVPTHKL